MKIYIEFIDIEEEDIGLEDINKLAEIIEREEKIRFGEISIAFTSNKHIKEVNNYYLKLLAKQEVSLCL